MNNDAGAWSGTIRVGDRAPHAIADNFGGINQSVMASFSGLPARIWGRGALLTSALRRMIHETGVGTPEHRSGQKSRSSLRHRRKYFSAFYLA